MLGYSLGFYRYLDIFEGHGYPEVELGIQGSAVGFVVDLCVQEGGKSFIHPGMFELVAGDQTVEISVTKLVYGHTLGTGNVLFV